LRCCPELPRRNANEFQQQRLRLLEGAKSESEANRPQLGRPEFCISLKAPAIMSVLSARCATLGADAEMRVVRGREERRATPPDC
jgi:hypothetical protein